MATTRVLVRYNAWANALMFNAVAELPPGEATKVRRSLFPNMVHTLNHNYIVASIWRARLEKREHGFSERSTVSHPPLDELWSAQRAMDEWYIAFSDGLSEAALQEPINFTLIGGNQGVMTIADIMLHIVNHTTYHHGYVADMFYQVPACPPTTDLPVFLRETTDSSIVGHPTGKSL
jgi:uncharacterized damage-inducible protein DinB